MPFRVPSSRIAQASPSISLEKGSYRMRAPPTRAPARPSRLRTSKSQARADGAREPKSQSAFIPASYEKRMALLVVLLACATMASFGVAYYLWTTRCVCLSFEPHVDACPHPESTAPRPTSFALLADITIPRTLFSRFALLLYPDQFVALLVSIAIVIRVSFVLVFVVVVG